MYVAGILHDLGQIIVTYLHPDAMEQMAKFCKEKDIPLRILEHFSFGLNHADIGALIAMKWNFPDQLVQGIKYHHDPLMAPVQYKDVVYCVYVANAFCDLERDYLTFEQMEKPVLGDFGIRNEEQMQEDSRKAAESLRAAEKHLLIRGVPPHSRDIRGARKFSLSLDIHPENAYIYTIMSGGMGSLSILSGLLLIGELLVRSSRRPEG